MPPGFTSGNLDPTLHATLALLHNGKVHRLPCFQLACDRGGEYEFVIKCVGQIAPRPGDFAYTLADLRIPHAIRFGVLARHHVKLPSRLGHWLYGEDTFWNAHANCHSRRVAAAVRYLEYCLVGRTNRRLLILQRNMSEAAASSTQGYRQHQVKLSATYLPPI